MVAIIKEVAPISGYKTDAQLGVGEFQSDYWNGLPVYMDSERKFFTDLMGDKRLGLGSLFYTWNPLKMYSDFGALKDRMKKKNIKGNLAGEGTIKGGVALVQRATGAVLYQEFEETGAEPNYDQIAIEIEKLK